MLMVCLLFLDFWRFARREQQRQRSASAEDEPADGTVLLEWIKVLEQAAAQQGDKGGASDHTLCLRSYPP